MKLSDLVDNGMKMKGWRYTVEYRDRHRNKRQWMLYEVRTFADIPPEHREAIAVLEAAYDPTDGDGVYIPGVGRYTADDKVGPSVTIFTED